MSSTESQKTESQKPELIAIYRLEFYKKQNNWKLSSSRKAKKPEKPDENKKNLNVTYNIDNPESEEQSDPHNIAFDDTDSDNAAKSECIKSKPDIKNKELSQKWLESINIWPESESWDPSSVIEQKAHSSLDSRYDNCEKLSNSQCVTLLGTPKTKILKRLEELQKAAISHLKEQRNAEEFSEECPESLELNDAWVEQNIGNEDCVWDRQCYQDSPLEADVLNIAHVGPDIWSQVPQSDVIDGLYYPEDVRSPEDFQHGLFGDVPSNEAEPANRPQEAEDSSVDSEGEFMRGAHAAPHSSETELVLPPELNPSVISFSSLYRLSSSQLLEAARQYSLVLRKLLQESEHRQKLRKAASLNSFSGSSFEELPTRDVGLHNPEYYTLNMNTFYKDVFIAGSYKNVGGVRGRGRGRGRLVDTPLWR